MYLYLALHGTYGMFWVMKDVLFPDSRWLQKASLGSVIATFLFLTLYWFIPVPLAAGLGISNPSNARIVFLVVLYVGGLILMLGSDYQKYHALKQKPGTHCLTQVLFQQVSSRQLETPTT
jgi:succinate dehydrogenase hydrophobic anchor subunit